MYIQKLKILDLVILCMVLLCIPKESNTQSSEYYYSVRTFPTKPKIGLALSGGAAHGLAHVGVIKYLDEIGIDVDYVTGTSMGAIIGALYAMGYNGEKISQIAAELNWDAILNNEIQYKGVAPVEKYFHDKYPLTFVINGRSILLPQGFLNTNNLELVLAKLFSPALDINDFSQLPRPFQCFGVDIEKGDVVTLKEGRLDQALRASMAIPSVFSPKKYNGRWLVDGGLIRNFPVSNNWEMGSQIVIGSYVGRERADISELNDLLDILSESAFMASIADSDKEKDMVDILLCPDVKNMEVFGFDEYEKFIELGYNAAKEQHLRFEELKEILDQFPEGTKRISLHEPDFIYIDSVTVQDIPKADRKLALDKLQIKPRSFVSSKQIESGISRITSTLNFESVAYEIHKNEDATTNLIIKAKPREVRSIGVNINHFSSTNSSLIINGQIRNLLFRLSNLRMTLRLSDNPGIAGEYYLRGGPQSKNWIFGIRASAEKQDHIFWSKAEQRKNGFLWEGHIIPYVTYEFNNFTSLRLELDGRRHDFNNELREDEDFKRYIQFSSKLGVELIADNRDERIFTTKGTDFRLRGGYGFNTGEDSRLTKPDITNFKYPKPNDFFELEMLISHTSPLRENVWWTMMADLYYRNNPSLLDNIQIGGTGLREKGRLSFIGYRDKELVTNQHVYVRSDFRLGVFDQVSIAFVANALVGNSAVFQYSDQTREETFTAYGLGVELGVTTPVGPILLDIGYSSEAKDILFELSVGWRHFY